MVKRTIFNYIIIMFKILFVSLLAVASANTNVNASNSAVCNNSSFIPSSAVSAAADDKTGAVYVIDGIVKTKEEYNKMKSAGKIAQNFFSNKVTSSQSSFLGKYKAQAAKYGAMFALSKNSGKSSASYKKMMNAYTKGKAQYDSGKKKYEAGKKDYESAKQDYNDAKQAGKEIKKVFEK